MHAFTNVLPFARFGAMQIAGAKLTSRLGALARLFSRPVRPIRVKRMAYEILP
jgi:hypothetical protein